MKKQKNLAIQNALLLLALYLVLLGPSLFVETKVDRGVKSADSYWGETGLTSKDLEPLLTTESCLKSHRNFLGCVNSISAMAERLGLSLSLEGKLIPLTTSMLDQKLTEKIELTSWDKKFSSTELTLDFSFLSLWKQIESQIQGRTDRLALIATGINGFLSVTQDPHTYILPMAMYEEVIARSDARPANLGFISRRVKGGAYVRKIFEGSPAAQAGLRKGDRILEINGQSVMNLMPAQYSDLLKGRIGDRIRLSIERNDHGLKTTKYVELLKSEAVFPNVLSKFINEDKKLGLITIHKFSRETCRDVRTHLLDLQQEGLRGLILDLRDNPGGQVDEAACILNLFVEKSVDLFETRYLNAGRAIDRYRTDRPAQYRGPISVLINGGSASASEIVAGSLKDLGRATLIGERSFGKGSFQDGRAWKNNSRIAYFQTEGFYYFPSGWTPQLVGLEPDIKVTSLEDETLREEDLYYQPLKPFDLWTGPQNLAWMNESSCATPLTAIQDDPQIEAATDFLGCDARSSSRD